MLELIWRTFEKLTLELRMNESCSKYKVENILKVEVPFSSALSLDYKLNLRSLNQLLMIIISCYMPVALLFYSRICKLSKSRHIN